MKKFFSCLFVKFVLYTGRFLGEGTGFLLSFIGLNSITENRGINGKSHQRKIQRHFGAEAVHFLRHGRWICEMASHRPRHLRHLPLPASSASSRLFLPPSSWRLRPPPESARKLFFLCNGEKFVTFANFGIIINN